jgi:hypothetical protein
MVLTVSMATTEIFRTVCCGTGRMALCEAHISLIAFQHWGRDVKSASPKFLQHCCIGRKAEIPKLVYITRA